MKPWTTVAVLFAFSLVLPSAFAQKKDKDKRKESREQPRVEIPRQNFQRPFQRRGPGPHFGDWLRNNQGMSFDEQQKRLETDPNFQQLPDERKERMRERLRKFNSYDPEKRQRILQRMEVWEHMTPEQQTRARELFAEARTLPPDRHKAVVRGLRDLRELPSEERDRQLNSDQYRKWYNDQERDLLRRMLELSPGTAREQ